MQQIYNFYTLYLQIKELKIMKKLFAASVIVLLILGSCVKNDAKCGYNDSTVIAPASEVQALQDSLTAHGIQATSNPSGFFYTINTQGTGQAVSNLCSNLSVTYKGSFFNGKVFDSSATGNVANFQLGGVIVGWQKGVPLISKGGDITLYIPPSLGYGPNPAKDSNGNPILNSDGTYLLPGNSYLVFNVKIIDIQ